MNSEDITRMAREAGLLVIGTADGSDAVYTWPQGITHEIERFAALVAAAAKLEMLMAGHDEWLEEARKAEREACIIELERNADKTLEEIIAAIRARENT